MKSRKVFVKEYFELFLLLLITVGPFSPTIKIVLYMIILILNTDKIQALMKNRVFYLLIIISMIIPMVLDIRNIDSNTPYSKASFAYFAPFVLSLVYVKMFDRDEFLIKLEKTLFITSVISLIGFSLVMYAPYIIEKFPVIVYYGRNVKSILIFGAIRDYTSVSFLHRNCGIAFEPGAFQFVPNLGLAILIKFKTNVKGTSYWIRVVVYAITVITTYSTTGFAILILLLLYDNIINQNRKSLFITISIITLLGGILYSSYQYQIVKYETGNFSDRFANSIYVLNNYAHYIFGVGSTGYDKIYQLDKRIGSWDTFTNLYLRFGLLFTSILIYLNVKLRKISIPICITVILTLMSESIVGPIIVMLYYYSYETDKEQEKNLERKYGNI